MRFARHCPFLLATVLATAAVAGPASGSSSRSSGAGISSRPAPVAPKPAPAPAPAPTKPAITPAPAKATIVPPKTAPTARASLLGGQGPQPSQHVTEIIREREKSGPGWIGTAFLVSMLSRHDLSGSDRSWIQSRIDDARKKGDQEAAEPELLPAAQPSVRFAFDGVEAPVKAGQLATVQVAAHDRAGRALPVTCEAPPDARSVQAAGHTDIAWTPPAPGAFMVTCRAGGHVERRLVRVVAPGAA